LILAAAIFRRRSLWILSVGAFIAIGPMMDLCVPWRAALAPDRHGATLRVMTCNTHYLATDPNALADAIAATNPDLIALQECAPRSAALFANAGWYVRGDGEFLLVSRFPIRKAQDITRNQKWWSAVGYEIQTPSGPIHFFNVHLASPHYAFRAALHREPNGVLQVQTNTLARLHGAQKLNESQKGILEPCLLAGDFNLPSDSTIFREHLSSFTDAFTERGFGFGLTYHAQWTVTRIDHILSSKGWECRKCWVGPAVGSPHRPLIADLEWVGSQAH
jgi:endonuclease/exonuclease/phosphatase family metal-dependent hydrolase